MSRIFSSVKKAGRKVFYIRDRARQRGNLDAARKQLASIADGDYFVKPIPIEHIVQWASPNLVSDILDGKIQAADDLKWCDFGFENQENYEYWSWRICGLMCVKNVLDNFNLTRGKTVADLTFEGENLGGYDVKNDKGWYYAPLIKLAEKYGLAGRIHNRLTIEEIAAGVLKNEFVIASVHPEVVRGDLDKNPNNDSGHLVLVVGFRYENGKVAGVYFNNPSGRTAEAQKKAYLAVDHFREAFASRGFSLRKGKK